MIMPFDEACRMQAADTLRRQALRKQAEREVLAKFPAIIVGSTGWHRAVEARWRRLR